jgi:hypothetical protein
MDGPGPRWHRRVESIRGGTYGSNLSASPQARRPVRQRSTMSTVPALGPQVDAVDARIALAIDDVALHRQLQRPGISRCPTGNTV